MLQYKAGFSVLKFDGTSRSCGKGLYFEEVKSLIASGINPCDYSYTSEVICELRRLLSEEIYEYEWGGGERTCFISDPELTMVTDNFSWQENFDLPTSDILELMHVRKRLMDDWSKDEITNLIKDSFEKVREDKSKYIDDGDGIRYKVLDAESGLIVLMILLGDDFILTPQEYCDQLIFNPRFFPPQ